VVREQSVAQAESAAQAELVAPGESADEEIWRDLPSVHTINQRRGLTRRTSRSLTFQARARLPIVGSSATPTEDNSATPIEIRPGIRAQSPPAARDSLAIGFLTIDLQRRIDPPRRVALATRCADSAADRMPEAVAPVRSAAANLAELRNARATEGVPV
jgi:hypothetical protein